jgi:DNA-binding response OmpR family regulator
VPDNCPLCGGEIETPDIILGPDYGLVIRDRKVALLTGKEWDLFECLYHSKLRVVPKDQIMSHLYRNEGDDPSWGVLDQFLHRARPKLARLGIVITAVRNEGYYLRFDPV